MVRKWQGRGLGARLLNREGVRGGSGPLCLYDTLSDFCAKRSLTAAYSAPINDCVIQCVDYPRHVLQLVSL